MIFTKARDQRRPKNSMQLVDGVANNHSERQFCAPTLVEFEFESSLKSSQ